MVTAIVNPFGPTMFMVGAVGSFGLNTTLELVRAQVNPFKTSAEKIGRLSLGTTFSSDDFAPIFPFLGATCPSLAVLSGFFPRDARVELLAALVGSAKGARLLRDRVREHYGDPWTRIGEEVEEALFEPEDDDPLDDDEAYEFAASLLSSEHMRPEARALVNAWTGAIEHSGLPVSMDTRSFMKWYSAIEARMA